jgi:hypothetical protein
MDLVSRLGRSERVCDRVVEGWFWTGRGKGLGFAVGYLT